MKPSPEKNPATARRRTAAEAQLKKQNQARSPQSEADVRRLQHELEVHQIQLEMQNSEMESANKEINAGLERYTELFDFAPAGYFNLTADGTIRLVNLTGATLLGFARAQLLGQRLNGLVAEGDRKIFSDFLARVFAADQFEHDLAEMAHAIANNAPLTIKAAKAAIAHAARLPDAPDLAIAESLASACYDSADYVEGRSAFLEKRSPRFTGY